MEVRSLPAPHPTIMPGIAGIISRIPNSAESRTIGSMVLSLVHEPGLATGTWASAEVGFWAGWARGPGAVSTGQPIWNENRNVCLLFFGENFAAGFQSQTGPDSLKAQEVGSLLEQYEKVGLRF